MIRRRTGSETSESVSSIASRGLQHPETLTLEEIKTVCASALVQREPPTIPIKPRSAGLRGLRSISTETAPPRRKPHPRWSDVLRNLNRKNED